MDAATTPAPDAGRDAGADAGPTCSPRDVSVIPAIGVEVIFLVDRSGSMARAFDGTPADPGELTRWDILRDGMGSVLAALDPSVHVGAKFFPSQTGIAIMDVCRIDPGLDVPLAPRAGPRIVDEFDRWPPRGGTPTFGALGEAADAFVASGETTSARFVVVATDGAPECELLGGPERLLEEVARVRLELGIDVYVLGIASRGSEIEFLDQLAIAGGRARPPTEERRFYDARDEALVGELLREITSILVQCEFLVPDPPELDAAIEIRVDGVPVAMDPTRVEGWDWVSEDRTRFSLFGSACDRFADGAGVTLTVVCR